MWRGRGGGEDGGGLGATASVIISLLFTAAFNLYALFLKTPAF